MVNRTCNLFRLMDRSRLLTVPESLSTRLTYRHNLLAHRAIHKIAAAIHSRSITEGVPASPILTLLECCLRAGSENPLPTLGKTLEDPVVLQVARALLETTNSMPDTYEPRIPHAMATLHLIERTRGTLCRSSDSGET